MDVAATANHASMLPPAPPNVADHASAAPIARKSRPLARAQSMFDCGLFVNQKGLDNGNPGLIHVPLEKRDMQRVAKTNQARDAFVQSVVHKYREKESERWEELAKAGLLPESPAPYVYVGCLDHRVTKKALSLHFERALRVAESKARVRDVQIRFAHGHLCYTDVMFPNGHLDSQDTQYALVQFTEKSALPIALRLNGSVVNDVKIGVTLSAYALPEMHRMTRIQLLEMQELQGGQPSRPNTRSTSKNQRELVELTSAHTLQKAAKVLSKSKKGKKAAK